MQLGWIFALKNRGVGGYPKARLFGDLDGVNSRLKHALPADQFVVALLQSVHMNAKGQIRRGSEALDLTLKQDRIGAQVDEFLAFDQAAGDSIDIGVNEWLTTSDRYHRRPTFLSRFKAFLRR